MKKSTYLLLSIFLIGISSVFSQDREPRDPRSAPPREPRIDPRGAPPCDPRVDPREAPPRR